MNPIDVPHMPAAYQSPSALPYFDAAWNERLRRTGSFAAVLGCAGAVLSTLTILAAGGSVGGARFAFQSQMVGDAILYGVPLLLVACFVPLASSGLRLRKNWRPAPAPTRQTLALMRALLLCGMLVSLIGVVFAMNGRGSMGLLPFGAVSLGCFVASAVLATRVRDALFDLAEPINPAPTTPEPRAVLPVEPFDESAAGEGKSPGDWPAAAPALGMLNYAAAADDPVRDFLRLFDLLAIFGCVAYGLQVPRLVDHSISLLAKASAGGLPVSLGNNAGTLRIALVLLSTATAIGWALWGALYVARGPVYYRVCFALAAAGIGTALLAVWGNLMDANLWTLSLFIALYPAVMLFGLTRKRVRGAFAERSGRGRDTDRP